MKEAYAISRGTKCQKFLFSLSLNPPPDAEVKTASFEAAIDRVEDKLGLTGQPRAIVFHEKENADGVTRRHAHAVWSRIQVENMKAVQLSFSQKKLRDVSRALYLEHGWKMPRGFINEQEKSPLNYTHAEWQQAKRAGIDAREIKKTFQDAWATSDSKAAFTQALQQRGYWLARGDRRGFVGIDVQGEIYSIPRMTGVKTKDVRLRLGDEQDLPGVDETKDRIAKAMLPKLQGFETEMQDQRRIDIADSKQQKADLITRQQAERKSLSQKQDTRRIEDAVARQARLRKGLGGLWDRLRGENKRIQIKNEKDAVASKSRDKTQRDALVFKHMEQRKSFNAQRLEKRTDYIAQRKSLRADMQSYLRMKAPPQPTKDAKAAFMQQRRSLREEWSKTADPPQPQRSRAPKPER